jgi:hypothetical protein
VVEFVEFRQNGFVLHMCQAQDEKPLLGPCMVEVTEQTSDPQPIVTAIYHYYSLIQRGLYDDAWPMLSTEFRASLGFTTVKIYADDWKRSGPAIITGLSIEQLSSDSATVILDLRYDKAVPGHKNVRVRYWLRRSPQAGTPAFAYWLFSRGQKLAEN